MQMHSLLEIKQSLAFYRGVTFAIYQPLPQHARLVIPLILASAMGPDRHRSNSRISDPSSQGAGLQRNKVLLRLPFCPLLGTLKKKLQLFRFTDLGLKVLVAF